MEDESNTGKVYNVKISGIDVKNQIFVQGIHNFERTLFQFYAARTKIVMDVTCDDNLDLCYDREYY